MKAAHPPRDGRGQHRDAGLTVFRGDVWLRPRHRMWRSLGDCYNLGRSDVTMDRGGKIYVGCVEFTLPHNVSRIPAVSLPLRCSTGFDRHSTPAGPRASPLQLAARLEEAMPWKDRVPPHVSRRTGPSDLYETLSRPSVNDVSAPGSR